MFRGIGVLGVLLVVTAALAGIPALGAAETNDEETRVCPGCGEEIPVTEVFCPYCHRYLPDAKVRAKPEREKTEVAAAGEDEPIRRLIGGRVKGGLLAGSGMTNAGLWASLGYRVADQIVVGLTFGYQDYPNGDSFPLCAAFRANLTRGKVSPVVYADAGYNKARFEQSFTGGEDPSGPVIGAGGGLDVMRRSGVGFTVEGGARFESSKEFWRYYYPGGYFGPVMSKEKTFSYFQLGAGVVF